jgi:hypothetical protein
MGMQLRLSKVAPEKRRRSAALHKAGAFAKSLSKISRLMECGAPAPLSSVSVVYNNAR